MIISLKIGKRTFQIDGEKPLDISIPLIFNGPQPNAYGVEPASSTACEYGDLVGDTRRGGSCNFERVSLITHCSGTHTECVGHITNERITVRDCLQDVFIPATLISVKTEESDDDLLITRKSLEAATSLSSPPYKGELDAASADGVVLSSFETASRLHAANALVVRTLPNDNSKLSRHYGEIIPPFFTHEAMEYIVELGVKHLLVDLPSIDRLFDEGKLSNHRIFWNVEEGSFKVNEKTRMNSTITELIYVPDEIEDGEYLLNLQIAPFASDASPSRPILFKI